MSSSHPLHAVKSSFFITGGTLPSDALCYVERKADRELFESLLAGHFCYVLTSRQLGKSSLMIRTANRLSAESVRTAIVDLTGLGQQLSLSQWYYGMLMQVGEQLGSEDAVRSAWHTRVELAPVQRFIHALRDALLRDETRPLVLFVDEIDVVRSLPFPTDEFFAAIRECYNRRQHDPVWNRVSFCLLGVAAPSDLISDPHITPFNIGTRIELGDFTPEESGVLAAGLSVSSLGVGPNTLELSKKMLRRVLYWTGGHPYLTQRLCLAVSKHSGAGVRTVDEECHRLYLDAIAGERDDNIQFVRDRLLRRYREDSGEVNARTIAVLDLYKKVRLGRRVPTNLADPVVTRLLLSGIVTSRRGILHVRNRIYEEVFSLRWIADRMPDAENRKRRALYHRGLAYGVAGTLALVSTAGFALLTSQEHLHRAHQESARTLLERGVRQLELGDRLGLQTLTEAAERADSHSSLSHSIDDIWDAWHRYYRDKLRTRLDLNASPLCAGLSPDGKWLIAGLADGRASLVSLASGITAYSGTVLPERPLSVDFAPDSTFALFRTRDGATLVDVRDLRSMALEDSRFALIETGPTRGSAFDATDRKLITWNDSGVSLWDLNQRRTMGSFATLDTVLRAYPIRSPNGVLVITRRSIEVWNWGARPLRQRFTTLRDPLRSTLSPEAHTFTGSGTITTLAPKDYEWLTEAVQRSSTDGCQSLSLVFDHGITLASSWESQISVQRTGSMPVQETPLKARESLESIKLSGSGKTLLALAPTNGYLYDVETHRLLYQFPRTESVLTETLSHSGAFLLQANRRGAVRIWDAAGDPRVTKYPSREYVNAMTVTDDNRLFTLSDRAIREWRMGRTGSRPERYEKMPLGQWSTLSPDGEILANVGLNEVTLSRLEKPGAIGRFSLPSPITARVFSPGGGQFAVATTDGSVSVYATTSGFRELQAFQLAAPATELRFSNDGNRLLSFCDAGVYVIQLDPAARPIRCYRESRPARFLDPGGRQVLIGGPDGELILFEPELSKSTSLGRQNSRIYTLGTSPRTQSFAIGMGDGTIRVFSRLGQSPQAVISATPGAIRDIQFDAEGNRVIVTMIDNTLSVYDAFTGHPLGPSIPSGGGVGAVQLSPNGNTLGWTVDQDAYAMDLRHHPTTPPAMRRETAALLQSD